MSSKTVVSSQTETTQATEPTAPHPPPPAKKPVVRRLPQQTCSVCGIKLRSNDTGVCKKWECQYRHCSERAAYFLHLTGVARTHLNFSREKHVDDAGIGQLTGSCKICEKLISNGCGQERCDVLCPWCICDTRLCRNRVYKQFQWYALPRRCFASGCEVIISAEVLSVFGANKTTVSLTDSDGQEFVSCGECRSEEHPDVYCKDHGDHYYHDWVGWLPKRKKKRKAPPPRTKPRKKPTIESVIRLSPVSMPVMTAAPIPNFLNNVQAPPLLPPSPGTSDQMRWHAETATPPLSPPSFDTLFGNVNLDHLCHDLDLDNILPSL